MTSRIDAPLKEAARALDRGDPLRVLTLTADDPAPLALALRGVALAQIDERGAALVTLARAASGFALAGDRVSAVRAELACAEVDLSMRASTNATSHLVLLSQVLAEEGDRANSAWALVLAARAAALHGDATVDRLLANAARATRGVPHVDCVLAMVDAERKARALDCESAFRSATRAHVSAGKTGHPALIAEVHRFRAALAAPIARATDGKTLGLREVSAIVRDPTLIVVDACRARVISSGHAELDLSSRPILFALLVSVASAFPDSVASDAIARDVFEARRPNDSHDARLRVELGRLRSRMGKAFGALVLERRALRWEVPRRVCVILPLVARREARLRAALGDGRAWSVPALVERVGQSARTVQRTLADLSRAGDVDVFGSGRARSYALSSRATRIASWMLLSDAVGRR